MAMAQLNVRIDEDLKAAGDRVLERFGVSAVQVGRDAWQYMADHQKLPEFSKPARQNAPASEQDAHDAAQEGSGMAIRMAVEAGLRAELERMTYDELRETAFEEMLAEQAEQAGRAEHAGQAGHVEQAGRDERAKRIEQAGRHV